MQAQPFYRRFTAFLTRAVLIALAAGVLSACSTMNEKECRTANWGGLGYEDSSRGRAAGMLSDRAEACREHGFAVDMPAYTRGWNEGLKAFCTATGGQQFGDSGGRYQPGYCPLGMESDFLVGYLPAYKRYEDRRRLADLQSQIDRKNNELIRLLSKKDGNDGERISRLRTELSLLNSQKSSESMRQMMGR